jgi:hypothetical protein
MSEVVKAKRPVSVWLSQALLTVFLVLLVPFLIASYRTYERTGFAKFIAVDYVLISSWFFLCIFSFVALVRRSKYGRWMAVAVFLGAVGFILFMALKMPPHLDPDSGPGPVGLLLRIVLLLALTVVMLILSGQLLFSRNVKMFFDPSLIPQVDDSSAIFHEPPPPPRFDE